MPKPRNNRAEIGKWSYTDVDAYTLLIAKGRFCELGGENKELRDNPKPNLHVL